MSLAAENLSTADVNSYYLTQDANGQRNTLTETEADADVAPPHAVNIAPRWNESKSTIWKLSATLWCGFVMGANDAAYGAIIPYVRPTRSAMPPRHLHRKLT